MKSFRIKNIKSFIDSENIEIKPITILVGKNSSGKSSLLRFPAILAQTSQFVGSNPPLSFFGEYIDYGNFEDVVYRHENKTISFSLCYNVDISGNSRIMSSISGDKILIRRRKDTSEFIKPTTISVTLKRVKKEIKVSIVELFIEDKKLSRLEFIDDERQYKLTLFQGMRNNQLYDVEKQLVIKSDEVYFEKFFPVYEDEFEIVATACNINMKRALIEKLIRYRALKNSSNYFHAFSDDEKPVAELYDVFMFTADVMRSLYEQFTIESKQRISYIGPFRQIPNRIYRNSETQMRHVGTKGENVGNIIVGASESMFDDISNLLKDKLGYELSIENMGENYFQLMVKDETGISSNIIDVGFGISQVLPIIVEICLMSVYQKRKNKSMDLINNIVLIEQPELHLHPAAQAGLADLFNMCVQANSDNRLIIETHSEHLISKLQVLIADEQCPLTNDMVQILYIDKDDDGAAYIKEIKIKENGKFDTKWPEGFFDQGFNLSYQLMKKAAERERDNID